MNHDQVEVFCNSCKVPINLVIDVVARVQIIRTPPGRVIVLLPKWYKRGFDIVDGISCWRHNGGKVMEVEEAHLRGKVPLDIAPLM